MSLPAHNEYDPIAALHQTMDRVRNLYRDNQMASFLIAQAENEVESQPVNQEFLDNFFGALPVNFNNSDTYPNRLIVCHRPQEVSATRALAVRFNDEGVGGPSSFSHPKSGLIIGESIAQPDDPNILRILMAVPQPDRPTTLIVGKVLAEDWTAKRQALLKEFVNPLAHNPLDSYDSSSNTFRLAPDEYLNLRGGVQKSGLFSGSWQPITGTDTSRQRRRMEQAGQDSLREVGFCLEEDRGITAADFIGFNVLYHLEVIASIYDRADQLAELNQNRNTALPPSPETEVFGLPSDYRLAIERTSPIK